MDVKTLIAQEDKVRAYPLDIQSAFDLKLYQFTATGNYQLIVFMKIQFLFQDDEHHVWTELESDQFMEEWDREMRKTWGNQELMNLPSGEKVYLNFDFLTKKGRWMLDHWEVYVTKIAPGDFKVSCVDLDYRHVHLDSEDLVKQNGQRGAVHEFGHMIGLHDEYNCSRHYADYKSVMNATGERIRQRHTKQFREWVINALVKDYT